MSIKGIGSQVRAAVSENFGEKRAQLKDRLHGEREPCKIKEGDNRAPEADIDYSDLPAQHQAGIKTQCDSIAGQILELRAEIKQAQAEGDHEKAAALGKELGAAESTLADLKFEIENPDVEGTQKAALFFNANYDTRADADAVQEILDAHFGGEASAVNDASDMAPTSGAGEAGKSEQAGKSEGSGASEKSGGAQGAGAGNSEAGKMIAAGGASIREEMMADPEAFATKLGEMDPMMAGAVMNEMQNYIQTTNRMWSTMTNLMKAEHDTQKALINNIRV